MQQDRFTVKAQEAIAAAQRLAAARRNSQVAPHHVLLALLEQDGGIVVPILRRANADPESVRRRANEALDALPTVSGDGEAPTSLGSDLVDTLKHADEAARSMGDEFVSTEHLLLALADDPKVDAGASRAQLAEAVEQVDLDAQSVDNFTQVLLKNSFQITLYAFQKFYIISNQ